jgi:CRP-like cAMP-binding protein
MSLLTGAPRSVTVTCTTPARLLVIGKEALGRAIEGHSEVIDQIGALVAARQLNSQLAREALHRERSTQDLAKETRSLIARMSKFLWRRRRKTS